MKNRKFLKILICLMIFIFLIFGILNIGFGMFKNKFDNSDKYLISYIGDDVTFSTNSGSLSLGSTTTVKITPSIGYYLKSFNCSNGYTNNAVVGESSLVTQTVTIYNNENVADSVCTAEMAKRKFKVTINENKYGEVVNTNVYDIYYGESVVYNYNSYGGGNYLKKFECFNDYTFSKVVYGPDEDGAYKNQNVNVYNNKVLKDAVCNVYTADEMKVNVDIVNDGGKIISDVDNSKNIIFNVKYGENIDFIVQPEKGYYLKNITCKLKSNDEIISSDDYSLSDYSTDVTNKKSRSKQTINISNNNYRGSVSCTSSFSKYEIVEINVNMGAKINSQYNNVNMYLDNNSDYFVLSPDNGYYLKSINCSNGYQVSDYKLGYGSQKIKINSLGSSTGGTCNVEMSNEYNVSFNVKNGKALINNEVVTSINMNFGNKSNIILKPNSGYYLESIICTNGYSVNNANIGLSTKDVTQNIELFQNNQLKNSICNINFAKANKKN